MQQLTEHFKLSEFTDSAKARSLGLDNTPTPQALINIQGTAHVLEGIRDFLSEKAGKPIPITITSGYRAPAVNEAVGSRSTSDHIKGMAADIIAPAFGTPQQIAAALKPQMDSLGIGQMILEGVKGKIWLHLSTQTPIKAINRVLTITDAGEFVGLREVA